MIAPTSYRNPDVAGVRRMVGELLRKDGIESAELEARLLVGHALRLDHAGLVAAQSRTLSGSEVDAISTLAMRRLAREPVARIVGRKEFWGLSFRLSAETLVPRPESETVVEATLAAVGAARLYDLRVADLGTGSGALLLALLSELPGAIGVGTDVSIAALATARENADELGFIGRCLFAVCHFGTGLRGGFDLVVSNPPYVATAEIDVLAPEVRDHDPRAALDGGSDGLDAYRAIAADAGRLLAPGGRLVIEIGAGQAGDVASVITTAGLTNASPPRADLAGVVRALTFARSS